MQNTQKITRAMEMVAASKMRKAQERMARRVPTRTRSATSSRTWRRRSSSTSIPSWSSARVEAGGLHRGVTDRGLCGGLNANLFPAAPGDRPVPARERRDRFLRAIGTKGSCSSSASARNLVAQATHLGDAPSLEDLIGTIKVMLDAYEGRIDRLYLRLQPLRQLDDPVPSWSSCCR
jgi:F-type H+-transporting ATPase subunit gamma